MDGNGLIREWHVSDDTLDLFADSRKALKENIMLGSLGRNRSTSLLDYSQALRDMFGSLRRRDDADQPELVHELRGLFYYEKESGKVYVVPKDDALPTIMKPGKYFQKLGLTADEANDLTNTIRSTQAANSTEVFFSTCSDTAAEIYRKGPHSCMSYENHEYMTSHHPAEVYATKDVCVVAVMQKDRIKARALFNKSTQKWGNCYGNYTLMKKAMSDLGHNEDCCVLEGCALKAIRCSETGAWVGPYLDGFSYVTKDGDYFYPSSGHCGDALWAESTDGVFGDGGTECPSCCERYHEDTMCWVDDEMAHICEHCIESYYVYSEQFDTYIHEYSAVYIERLGDYVPEGEAWQWDNDEDEDEDAA